jgi:hypothetical protein
MNHSAHQEFPILNQVFFSPSRPILFEDRACRPGYIEGEAPSEVIVFLVHGLGACRMDMEKLKVELKRYY